MTVGADIRPSVSPRARAADPALQRAQRRRVAYLRWLRRIHLYVGLWGAAVGLLFGATGIVLNHRAVLKIPVQKAVQRTVQLPLPEGAPARPGTPEAMAAWLAAELGFTPQQVRIKADAAATVVWGGREVEQPARWAFNLHSPQRGVSAEYYVGNRFVKAEVLDATPIGTLTRLHMSVGVNAFWVLLADSIAGALILLSATGLLLWSRMHPLKLSAIGVSLAALSGAAGYLWHVG